MKFGIREICDVVLKAKTAQKVGNKVFYKNEPVLYFDSLKTSSLEGASTTVYAQGGRGNARLIAWEGERTVTFTMEDALISPEGFSILTGAGLVQGEEKPIIMHTTEQTDEVYPKNSNSRNITTVAGMTNVASVDIVLSEKPYLGSPTNIAADSYIVAYDVTQENFTAKRSYLYTAAQNNSYSAVSSSATWSGDTTYYYGGATVETYDMNSSEDFIYVMAMKDGLIDSEPYIPSEISLAKHNGKYIISIKGTETVAGRESDDYYTGTDTSDIDELTTATSVLGDAASRRNDLSKFVPGCVVFVDYYTSRTTGAYQINITPDKFGGNYYLEASTLFRDTNGTDLPAEFVIPNCKIQSNFTFSMAASGDPSTFTFTMDAFPDYTRWDKTKKVFAAIQVFDVGEVGSELDRLGTPHNIEAIEQDYNLYHKPFIEL